MLIPTAHPAAPRASPKHANAPPWPGTIWEQKSFVNSRPYEIYMYVLMTQERSSDGDMVRAVINVFEADT